MKSLTKNEQSREAIERMVKHCFPGKNMVGYTELTEGYFNVAYEVELDSGEKVILKVAPAPGTRIMTYERNIMYSEVNAMKAAKSAGLPAPAVLGWDNSRAICASPYFFMEKLAGKSLNSIKSSLTDGEIGDINRQVGAINRRINDIRCPRFGYPGQPEFQGEQWFPVFRKMLEAGVTDAENGHVDIKIDVGRLWEMLDRDCPVFEEIIEPRLVHWDCWDGNIFVEGGKVTGIIDWERSLWADPLMEVGFRTYARNEDFFAGYGIWDLTASQKRRALWYDVYLMVLVSLECEYRQYETMDMYEWSTSVLVRQFEKLEGEF
ncbi:phosphotransferase family protein [Acutalibacter sp. 1XD8-36]|uniref:phosphotransferase family protein n=1 Tax=Acutalibacter sp. 1XD8-36 TaxID=2320852 RepID=UPI0014127792|nr:aminoglycoside phosphotransferase family protein [Acutalibacter sp. 1XD8-36]NBJ90918.1 aminoglycoside phosphotransferase family protein [Acutalibacter sp. 1XD8-36]